MENSDHKENPTNNSNNILMSNSDNCKSIESNIVKVIFKEDPEGDEDVTKIKDSNYASLEQSDVVDGISSRTPNKYNSRGTLRRNTSGKTALLEGYKFVKNSKVGIVVNSRKSRRINVRKTNLDSSTLLRSKAEKICKIDDSNDVLNQIIENENLEKSYIIIKFEPNYSNKNQLIETCSTNIKETNECKLQKEKHCRKVSNCKSSDSEQLNIKSEVIFPDERMVDVIYKQSENNKDDALDVEKNLSCSKCDYKTKYKSALQSHCKGAHCDSPDYMHCSRCDFMTLYKSNLKSHMVLKHSPDGTNISHCPHCRYSTRQKRVLKKHIENNHTDGPKPYSCPKCEFSTVYKNRIEDHLNSRHPTSEATFNCVLCVYSTASRRLMLIHNRKWHCSKLNRHSCFFCDFGTKYRTALDKHCQDEHEIFHPKHNCRECASLYSFVKGPINKTKDISKCVTEL